MKKSYVIVKVFIRLSILAAVIILFNGGPNVISAEEPDCSMCHPDLAKKKTVHAAVSMGCATCHTSLNVTEMPHKVTGQVPKGLSSAQPDLCYGCHDKGIFTKKNVHAALMMGCTTCHNPHSSDSQKLLVSDMPGLCFTCHDKTKFENKTTHAPVIGGMCTSCHNPHSSDNTKLLSAEAPDLCYTCHDKAPFSKKNVHAPVMGGMCLSCHSPHATEEVALLSKRPAAVCAECHANILKGRHVTAESKHPVGSTRPLPKADQTKKDDKKSSRKPAALLMDPAREGREFYCGSCHNPHSSGSMRLFRYNVSTIFDLCINCHKK